MMLSSQSIAVARCGRKRNFSHIVSDSSYDFDDVSDAKKLLREAMLKGRFANIIIKSEQAVLGKNFDKKEMKKKKEDWEKQFRELEKGKIMMQRKAARIAIESVKRTVEFDDGLQAERELLMMIGASS